MTVGYKAHPRDLHQPRDARCLPHARCRRKACPTSQRAVPPVGEPLEFREAPGGCDVDFFIAYEFKSLMMQMLVGGLFDRAFRRYTAAFEERARAIYGARSGDRTEMS